MIEARFKRSGKELTGFSVSGHSGYGEMGSDIVCASVSSAVMLICNAIEGAFRIRADIKVEDNLISCTLDHPNGCKLISALYDHLVYLSDEYPENVTVIISEV